MFDYHRADGVMPGGRLTGGRRRVVRDRAGAGDRTIFGFLRSILPTLSRCSRVLGTMTQDLPRVCHLESGVLLVGVMLAAAPYRTSPKRNVFVFMM